MRSDGPSDLSLDFYDRNADEFAERTLHLDMGALYEPFLARLPARAGPEAFRRPRLRRRGDGRQ